MKKIFTIYGMLLITLIASCLLNIMLIFKTDKAEEQASKYKTMLIEQENWILDVLSETDDYQEWKEQHGYEEESGEGI